MALNGVVNGTSYLLLIGGAYAMFGVTTTVQVNQGTTDISCRETDNWNTKILSTRDWSMDFEGKLGFKYNDGTTNSVHTSLYTIPLDEILTNCYANQDRVTLVLLPVDAAGPSWGSFAWYGEAYIAAISMNAPNEDSSSITMSFSGVGPFNQTVI